MHVTLHSLELTILWLNNLKNLRRWTLKVLLRPSINTNRHKIFTNRALINLLLEKLQMLQFLLVSSLLSSYGCIRPSSRIHGLIEQILQFLILCQLFDVQDLGDEDLDIVVVCLVLDDLRKLQSVDFAGELPLHVVKDLLLLGHQLGELRFV